MDFLNFILVTILIFLVFWKLCSKPAGFPKGPFRWPIVGNLNLSYGNLLHKVGGQLAREYGELVGLYFGFRPMVFVSGLEAIKEVGAREDLSGRPLMETYPFRNTGIILNYGEEWREQRRFTLRHLRDLGFGKQSMQSVIHEEVTTLLEEVAHMTGHDWSKPVPLQKVLGTSGINVLWYIMSGQRYAHADARLQRLTGLVKKFLDGSSAAGRFATFFPKLTRLFPSINTQKPIRDELLNFIREDVNKHKATLDPNNPRDFIDIYLTEIMKQSDNPDTTFTEIQLVDICLDLFLAGSDTTFNSITFALVYMVRFPHVQKLVQEELDRVVGLDRLPELSDRASLTYTEATLREALRMSSVVPLGVPHASFTLKNDVKFRGYVIPKDCRVLLNIAELHMDPEIWGDPENFRPERYIAADSKLIHYEALIPFGSGKRQCLGEALARNNLFLFFTAILQRYSLSVPPGKEQPSLEAVGGFTLSSKYFEAVITPRFITS